MKLIARGPRTYIAEISDEEIASIYGEEQLRDCTFFDKNGNRYHGDSGIVGHEIDLLGKMRPLMKMEYARKQYPLHTGNELRRLADEVDKAVDLLGPHYPWVKRPDNG